MDDGYICKNYYEFTQQEGDLQVQYNVTMAFEYINKKWTVTGVEETSDPIGFNAISGTWTGAGEYPENLFLSVCCCRLCSCERSVLLLSTLLHN